MKSHGFAKFFLIIFLALQIALASAAQESSGKRKIIIDQDAAGPAGTDQQSILLLIQSPKSEVLGITVVTGDAWLKDEVAHTLRMLELIARTDIPVVVGAELPLVRRKEETELWEQQFGVVPWVGAWTPRLYHPHDQLGDMPEGKPKTKPIDEDAAHFLIRMVHSIRMRSRSTAADHLQILLWLLRSIRNRRSGKGIGLHGWKPAIL